MILSIKGAPRTLLVPMIQYIEARAPLVSIIKYIEARAPLVPMIQHIHYMQGAPQLRWKCGCKRVQKRLF